MVVKSDFLDGSNPANQVPGNLITHSWLNEVASKVNNAPADTNAALAGKADSSHTHGAGDVTSGTFDAARIPNLPASKITSGTFDEARIPNLPGSKITSGTIAPARLGTGTADNTKFLRGDGTWQVPPTGGGGVTDHGALTGLSDDDHPQYHNDARGDARYYTKTQVDTALTGKADASRGLPSGGSTGQVLAKASGSNYDTEWVDPPEGGGEPEPTWADVGTYLFPTTGRKFTFTQWGANYVVPSNTLVCLTLLILPVPIRVSSLGVYLEAAPAETAGLEVGIYTVKDLALRGKCTWSIPTSQGAGTIWQAPDAPFEVPPGPIIIASASIGPGPSVRNALGEGIIRHTGNWWDSGNYPTQPVAFPKGANDPLPETMPQVVEGTAGNHQVHVSFRV